MNKKQIRLKKAIKIRKKIKSLHCIRLSVHKSSNHIYAQIISEDGCKTLASASTLDKSVKCMRNKINKMELSKLVGQLIANRSKDIGVVKVVFDRSGFKYHGCIKALADASRKFGLVF